MLQLKMACCDSWIKILLVSVNLLVAMTGATIVCIGVVLHEKISGFDRVLDTYVTAPPIILIAIGSISFLVAFCGCCGIMFSSKCTLMTYAVFLGLVFVVKVLLGIFVLAHEKQTKETFFRILSREFNETAKKSEAFAAVSALQRELECCGIDGPFDYTSRHRWHPDLSKSCCPSSVAGSSRNDFFRTGCAEALTDFLADHANVIGGVGIGLAFVEVVGIINALVLVYHLSKRLY